MLYATFKTQEQALAVAVLFLMQAAPLLYLWIVH